MINLDTRVLDKVNENELWLILHVAKRMQSNRMSAWPSLSTLEKDTGWRENTVRRWRKSLCEKGFLEIEHRVGQSPIYKFSLSGIGIFTPLAGEFEEENPYQKLVPHQKEPLPKIGTHPYQKLVPPPYQKLVPEVISNRSILAKGVSKENTPVSEKETVSLTTFSPGEKIENLELTIVEGETLSLDADSEQTCTGGAAKPARDHDSQILRDFANMGTPEQFEETKRRMMKKANNADRTAQVCAEITSHDVLAFFNAIRSDWQRWTDYKRREKKGPYKSAETEAVAIGQLFKKVNGDAQAAREAILNSIAQTYTGIWVDANAAKGTTVAADRYAMNDAPKAQTPDEMVREMSFFYRTHIHDGDDGRGLLNAAQKHAQTAYGPDRLNEVVRLFCANRLKNGRGGETFAQQHAALCEWLQNEKQREQRGQGGPSVFNPSDIRAQQRRANIED